MISKAKRDANARWDKTNMCNLSCRVRRDYAERVRACCEDNGDTVNAVLRAALDDYLERHERPEPPAEK